MDEEMEYAEMLEIPVSTVSVSKKRGRKPKKAQDLKEKVITKVNEDTKAEKPKRGRKPKQQANKTAESKDVDTALAVEEVQPIADAPFCETTSVEAETPTVEETPPVPETFPTPIVGESIPIAIPRRKKRPFFARLFGVRASEWEYEEEDLSLEKPASPQNPNPDLIDGSEDENLPIYNQNLYEEEQNEAEQRRARRNAWVVGIEFAACFALCLGIFLTNVFMPNSAINTFFRSLTNTEQTDSRTYTDFQLSAILSEENADLTLSPAGILSFREEGCVYPAVDGRVDTVVQNSDGTWTVKISHSDTFSEVISGLSYVACAAGSIVKSNVPIGYSDGNAEVQVSMYESGALLNCFTLTENGELVWAEE